MKALVLEKYGSPKNLTLKEMPMPELKNGQVLVKVKAVSINDWDLGIIEGSSLANRILAGLFKPKINILGSDISGVVVEAGEGVSDIKVGDKVYGDLSSSKFGGFAEYIATEEKHLAKMPEGMPFDIAASIPQAGMLAFQALYDFTEIKDNMKILINGAGGGVGTYAVQMLSKHKVHLTGVDCGVKKELVLNLGYDDFIDYKVTDFTKGDNLYDIIIDCKTNRPLGNYAKVLKEDGIYITVGGDIPKVLRIILLSKHLEKKHGRRYKCVILQTNRNLQDINKMFEEDMLTSIIDPRIFTLDDGREAMEYYASGDHLGKVVIEVEK